MIDLSSVDIRALFNDLDISYSESGKNVSEGWIGVQCPFCGDHSNHLGVNIDSKVISCFSCGTTGNVIKYLSEVFSSYHKAINIIKKNIPRELREVATYTKEKREFKWPIHMTSEMPDQHYQYLKKRKFNPEELHKKYNLRYVGPIGNWVCDTGINLKKKRILE